MTETQIALAAKAIRKTLERTKGEATPWSLARAALIAVGVSDETSVSDERLAKTMAKTKRYTESAKRGWKTKKRLAAARAEAEAQKVEAA